MSKITVIHFVHTLFGGVANVAANIINYEKSIGWKAVVVYANYDKSFVKLVGEDVELIKFQEKRIPGIYMCLGMDVGGIYFKYKKNHPQEKVICHVHNIQGLGALGNWRKVPLVCTLHSLNGGERDIRTRISEELYRIALIRLIRNNKPITSVSKAIVNKYARINNSAEIQIIYNGTYVDSSKRNKQNKFVIGHVGNLSYAKGWDTLFDAFCKIPPEIRKNMLLKAAGKEATFTFEQIKQLSKENGVSDQVSCLGYIGNAKEEFIPKIDVLVLASRNEGFGLVQVEAMGYGIPVLGRDTGGICEVLKDGYNGYVIESSNELAEKIQFLYENQNVYSELSQNARLTYLKTFTQKQMCESYISIYKRLLK